MHSLHTNAGAIGALGVLRSISANLALEQNKVSSGYRVASAADNAAYWSIATTMRSDDKSLSSIQDALGLGAATVDVAYSGMSASIDVVSEIKAKLIAAREPGVDRLKINKEITALKEQIYSIVLSSTFSGSNWLHRIDASDDGDKQIVGGFTRSADGSVSVQTLSYGMSNPLGTNHLIDENYHNGILTNVEFARNLGTATEWVLLSGKNHAIHEDMILTSTTTDQDVEEMVSVIDAMQEKMIDAAASLGAMSKRIATQQDFVADLRGATARGIGRLVDADMNEASTRLKALQTQEQLAIQSLSIANATSDTMLQLFRN
ncbi:flagellin [Hoeflea alexandrii]|uniref:flagellin N-terminal helical domain-containing protein n=1 Tax=Hoeflea alexandrii TaxID=288436 RepID=UPI0022AF356D|nr:flagellin [Hoeflea alexandrii]MCZ4289661.1 flagellin [Hoeflea alexandrii]